MTSDDTPLWLQHNPHFYDHDATSLFQLGSLISFKKELVAMARLIERLNHPWEETVSLPDPRALIAETFSLNDNDPLIDLFMDNEIVPITCADMFVGGSSEVVVSRVFYITNGEAIHDELSRHGPLGQEGAREFMRDFFAICEADFTQDGVVAAEGQIYVGATAHRKNMLLFDGERFRAIKHREQVESTSAFSSQDQLERITEHLNLLNMTRWKGIINVEWALKQPHYILEDTYRALDERYLAQLGSFIDSAEHGIHADDIAKVYKR